MKMLEKASPRGFLKASAAILMSGLLAACQSMSMESTEAIAPLGYSPELPQLTCASHGGDDLPVGMAVLRDAALAARSVA